MFVATMESESFEVVALGETEQQAREAVAAAWDVHLKKHGDENRERFLASCGYEYGPIPDAFGEDLGAFARGLNGWYGINVYELQPGEAAVH